MNPVPKEPCPSLRFSGKTDDFRRPVGMALSSLLRSLINELCDNRKVTYADEAPLANLKKEEFGLNIL